MGYFGDASLEQLIRWDWFRRNVGPLVRNPCRSECNPGSNRGDTPSHGDDADGDQHGDGHAGPDEHATGGVATRPVLDS